MSLRRLLPSLIVLTATTALLSPPAWADARATDDGCPRGMPASGFGDVPSSNAHAYSIDCVVHWRIAQGSTATTYNPSGGVTRAQMATFISRLITQSGGKLPTNVSDAFDDDNGTTHEAAINALAAAKVVGGTGNRTYSPNGSVTRGQMAAFLVRSYEYRTGKTLAAGEDAFDDDSGTTHEASINRAAAAGFAGGTAARTYAPNGSVQRDQMASFLARVLDKLVEDGDATVPPAPPVYLAEEDEVARSEATLETLCDGSSQQRSISGTPYTRSRMCVAEGTTRFIEWDLGRNYTSLEAVLGQWDDQENTEQTIRFRILGDGEELFTKDLAFGVSAPVSLDVTDVLRLRVEFLSITDTADFKDAFGVIGDPAVRAF